MGPEGSARTAELRCNLLGPYAEAGRDRQGVRPESARTATGVRRRCCRVGRVRGPELQRGWVDVESTARRPPFDPRPLEERCAAELRAKCGRSSHVRRPESTRTGVGRATNVDRAVKNLDRALHDLDRAVRDVGPVCGRPGIELRATRDQAPNNQGPACDRPGNRVPTSGVQGADALRSVSSRSECTMGTKAAQRSQGLGRSSQELGPTFAVPQLEHRTSSEATVDEVRPGFAKSGSGRSRNVARARA